MYECVPERVDLLHGVREGPLLVFVDHKGVGNAARGVKYLTQRRGSVLERSPGSAVTRLFDDFEELARCRHCRNSLLNT
jgi:hypothetical protein